MFRLLNTTDHDHLLQIAKYLFT